MIRLALAAVLLAAPAAMAQSPAPAAAAATVQMPHVSIVAIGAGPPVILIPGLSSPRAVWDGIAPTLATTHRVYLVQVNGFGGDEPRANLSDGVLDGMVADVAGFIAREKPGRPAVIGHSLGGLAGMLLAARHPAAVGRLMVVDALPFIGTIVAPGQTVEGIRPRAAAMRDAIAATHGTVRAMYDDMTTDATADMAKITARPFTMVYATGRGRSRRRSGRTPMPAARRRWSRSPTAGIS